LSVWPVAAAVLILAWWGWPAGFRRVLAPWASSWQASRVSALLPPPESRREGRIVRAAALMLALIFLSYVFGFMLLSNLLRTTVVVCSYIGLVMYTLVRVGSTLFAAVLHSSRMRPLATVRLHEAKVVKWMNFALKAGALLCWLYVTLDLLGLRQGAQ